MMGKVVDAAFDHYQFLKKKTSTLPTHRGCCHPNYMELCI